VLIGVSGESRNVSSVDSVLLLMLQQLECLTFSRDGQEFISCHSDGSYIIWTTDEPNFPKEAATTPYGNVLFYYYLPTPNRQGH